MTLHDERGSFTVQPRPPKVLFVEPWQLWHSIMGAGSLVGVVLLSQGMAASHLSPLNIARIGLGAAMLASAAVYCAMLPERKAGPSRNETDPRLLPRFDFHCAWLDVEPVPLADLLAQHRSPPAVPRHILQQWYGDHEQLAGRDKIWRQYAEAWGFHYTLITDRNLFELVDTEALHIDENCAKILRYEFERSNWWSVSDIVRYVWLAQHGGIYVDIDMSPPETTGASIDLFDVVAPSGLTLLTEEFGRDFGGRNGAICCNGFLSAPPQDATLRHIISSLPRNWAATNAHARSEYTHGGIRDAFACFATGPFFFNNALSGAYRIVPFRLAAQLGIVDGADNPRSYKD